jgi:hypothetical protein
VYDDIQPASRWVLILAAVKNLSARAWLSLAVLVVVMAFLLFVPAGTIHYWQAWVYLAIFTSASALITLDLLRRDAPPRNVFESI